MLRIIHREIVALSANERANERSSFINNKYFSELTMDIKTLLDRVDIIENNQPSIKKYLSEGLYNTPEMQSHWKRIDEGFIRGYEKYLAEVALTPDQIQNIFKQAGGAGGEAPKDPGKLAALVDKILPSNQAANLEKTLPEPDAGPVQGFEQKASAAVQGLQGVDSGTKQSLMQLVKAGISKPETQQLILAAVGAGLGSLISKVGPVLSMIPGGGPIASAITGAVVAGGVAVLAAKLRGEDWKSAFKGAIKPALMGGAAAVVGNLVTTGISSMMAGGGNATTQPNSPTQSDPTAPVGGGMKNLDGSPMTNAQVSAAMDRVAPVAGSAADPNKYYNSLSPDQQQSTNAAIVAQAQANNNLPDVNAGNVPNNSNSPTGAGMDPAYLQQAASGAPGRYIVSQQDAQAALDWQAQNGGQSQPLPPAGQSDWSQGNRNSYPGGLAQYYKDHPGVRENAIDKQATLKEWLRRDAQGLSINSVQLYPYVVEGIMDSLKGMFSGKGKEAAPAQGGGANADALNKAWVAAGSPTDSEEVAKILQGAGVPAETVTKVFTDLKLPTPGSTPPAGKEPAAPAAATAQEPAALKGGEIVDQLKSFWEKVTSNQGSATSSPQVQQQLIAMAKQAGLASQTFETKYSTKKPRKLK